MKIIIAIIISLFIIVSSSHYTRKGITQSHFNEISESTIGVGFLKINMFQDTNFHGIPIFYVDKQTVDTIFYYSDSVIVTPNVRTFIRYFYPEYGLVYFDVDSVDEVNGRYYIGKRNCYVMSDSEMEFIKWNDFLQTVFVEPLEGQELYVSPEQKIPNFSFEKGKAMIYTCDSVFDDWIHVETDTVCVSSQTSFFHQGWMKWKIGDSLVVKIHLNC